MRHDRWEISTVAGERLITDFAIRSYGRAHIERIVSRMFADPALCVPLPEAAWAADTLGSRA
jgi:hypothetical protein